MTSKTGRGSCSSTDQDSDLVIYTCIKSKKSYKLWKNDIIICVEPIDKKDDLIKRLSEDVYGLHCDQMRYESVRKIVQTLNDEGWVLTKKSLLEINPLDK